MYYILLGIVIALVLYVITRFVSSILKGCVVAFFLAISAGALYVLILSTKEPVVLLDMYVVDNFTIRRVDQ